MSEMMYDYLKWTDECGSQDLVMEEFKQRRIPYVLYERVRQSAAEQGLITGVINTMNGYFIPDDASLTVKGIYTLQRLKEYEVRHEQKTSEKKADEHGSQTHA